MKAQLGLGQLHYLNYFLRAADAGDAHAMAFLGKVTFTRLVSLIILL